MKTTPKTQTSNEPQRVLKSIEQQQQVVVNIVKEGEAASILSLLNGVQAFMGVFGIEDKCILELQLTKIESVVKEDEQSV